MSSIVLTSKDIRGNLRLLKLTSGDEIIGIQARLESAHPETLYLYLPAKIMHIMSDRGPMVIMTGFYPDASQPIVPIAFNHLIWSIKPPSEIFDAYITQYKQFMNHERFMEQSVSDQVKASQELAIRQQEYPPTRLQ